MSHTGKVAIITGAGSGLGQAAALKLAEKGASIVVVDLVEETGLATVKQIEKLGAKAIFVQADVSKASDVENYVKKQLKSSVESICSSTTQGSQGLVLNSSNTRLSSSTRLSILT